MNDISMLKTYRTRSGLSVRIYATDGKPPYSVHGAWQNRADDWIPISWTSLGRQLTDCQNGPFDLVEVKELSKLILMAREWADCIEESDEYPRPFKEEVAELLRDLADEVER